MTSPSPTSQPPETAKQLILRVLVYTAGLFLAISGIQWAVPLGAMMMGLTAVISSNKQTTPKLVPGLLIIFAFVVMMLVFVMSAQAQIGNSLLLRLRPCYVSVMIGIWAIGVFSWYRKSRSSRSDKQP